MFDGDYVASVRESDEAQAAARTFGFDITKHAIRRAEDIAPAFEAFKSQTDALYIVEDALVFANRAPIVTLALEARLPTSFTASAIVRAGGLMSYGPSYPALFQHAAEIVDKILREQRQHGWMKRPAASKYGSPFTGTATDTAGDSAVRSAGGANPAPSTVGLARSRANTSAEFDTPDRRAAASGSGRSKFCVRLRKSKAARRH
jgi:putative ABC transport system substrate-binding protein